MNNNMHGQDFNLVGSDPSYIDAVARPTTTRIYTALLKTGEIIRTRRIAATHDYVPASV